jgi:hypothetical protein
MTQENKHTPAPWVVKENKCSVAIHAPAYRQSLLAKISSLNIADAHLMAAAPDLLEALETWLQAAQSADETGYVDGVGFLDIKQFHIMAEQAIKKARGQS